MSRQGRRFERKAAIATGASLLVDGAWSFAGYPDMRPFQSGQKWNG